MSVDRSLKSDIISGFSVFLLALPLCLGIAMASNFPPIAGIFTAIIGGVISTFLGSTRLSIKGPAAGLIVIALGAVNDLGGGDISLGYKRALAVGVVAAIFQIIIALMRKAVLAEIMPPSVIRGMLAAIGVIIISKQSHVMMGVAPQSKSPLGLMLEIPHSLMNANPKVLLIGAIAFLVAILWPLVKKLAVIPASIVVLISAIAMSLLFDFPHDHSYMFMGASYNLGQSFLVNLPSNVLGAITFPDFSAILSAASIKYIIMFALLGSVESLLTVCAVDALDPEKQQSDLNKDLFAVGVGNLISSLIGGLPMISEIVRTKANIDYGAKTKYSNFFHGVFLLLAIIIFPSVIHLVPLSALAALLVYTGFRLASPKELKHAYDIGLDQFVLFLVTLIVTLVEDLLLGVAVGVVLKLLIHFVRTKSIRNVFKIDFQEKVDGTVHRIIIKGALTFTHYLKLKSLINDPLERDQQVILDLGEATLVDHTIMGKLDYLQKEISEDKFKVVGLDQLSGKSKHQLATRIASQGT